MRLTVLTRGTVVLFETLMAILESRRQYTTFNNNITGHINKGKVGQIQVGVEIGYGRNVTVSLVGVLLERNLK
jgi:hypothetical protein